MADEHGFQAQEGPRLCANNCGFFGSPTTQNLCSKCYRDVFLKKEQNKSSKPCVDSSLFTLPSSSSSSSIPSVKEAAADSVREALGGVSVGDYIHPGRSTVLVAAVQAAAVVAQPNRCLVCKKKVGLIGFTCRCGTTFCGTHRYPEQHGCTFDFKAMGRDAIAKANPIVKADKLEKI